MCNQQRQKFSTSDNFFFTHFHYHCAGVNIRHCICVTNVDCTGVPGDFSSESCQQVVTTFVSLDFMFKILFVTNVLFKDVALTLDKTEKTRQSGTEYFSYIFCMQRAIVANPKVAPSSSAITSDVEAGNALEHCISL